MSRMFPPFASAVIVLAVIAMFFMGGFSPGEQNVLLKGQQTNLCSQFASASPNCADTQDTEAIRTEIGDVCSKLGYPGCTSGQAADSACLQKCCMAF